MKQLRKRNNYMLSIEAQEIIDRVKNKSRFVSEAIVYKGGNPYDIVINAMQDLEEHKQCDYKVLNFGDDIPVLSCKEHDFEFASNRNGSQKVCVKCGYVHPGKFKQ